MLKKQTIWLLTMLSLMIVLSVYYLISDKEDLAFVQTDDQDTEDTTQQDDMTLKDVDVDVNDVKEIEQDEFFTMIRMELEDKRHMKKDRLKDIVASSSATTAEINEALNEMDTLERTTSKETILQESILAKSEAYEDVLVRVEDNKVHVHVITDDLPKEEAVQMMQMVRDELGEIPVDIKKE